MNLTIIIPVFNSSKSLGKLTKKIFFYIKKKLNIKSFEIIFINDFSSDNSWHTIINLKKKYNFIKGINLSENFGQHNAIMAGLNYAKGDIVLTMDDDFEHSPEFIHKFINELKYSDVCYTYYLNRKHSFLKNNLSTINNIVSSLILDKPINIYLSSYRAFKKKICKKIVKYKKNYVYLDYLILKHCKKINMIQVEHGKRMFGKSNYTIKKLFKLWSAMVLSVELYPIKLNTIPNLILKFILIFIFKIKFNNKHQFLIKEKTFN